MRVLRPVLLSVLAVLLVVGAFALAALRPLPELPVALALVGLAAAVALRALHVHPPVATLRRTVDDAGQPLLLVPVTAWRSRADVLMLGGTAVACAYLPTYGSDTALWFFAIGGTTLAGLMTVVLVRRRAWHGGGLGLGASGIRGYGPVVPRAVPWEAVAAVDTLSLRVRYATARYATVLVSPREAVDWGGRAEALFMTSDQMMSDQRRSEDALVKYGSGLGGWDADELMILLVGCALPEWRRGALALPEGEYTLDELLERVPVPDDEPEPAEA